MRAGWETRKLGDLLEVQNGYAFDSKSFSPSGRMPLIRIRDLKVGTETETRFTGDYDGRYLVNAGELLIGMDGEFGCYEWKGSPALLNQRVCRLQGFSSNLLPRFLLYGVNNHLKAIEDVTGFATVKHLSSKQVLGIEFPLPPLPEQKRIVAILDEAFAGIATAVANTEKNLANARELFDSYLNAVFTQKGEGWVEKRLEEIGGQVSTGPFGSLLHKSDYVPNGTPLVNPANIVGASIVPNLEKTVNQDALSRLGAYVLHANDIVIGRRGEIGRCAVVAEEQDGWLCGTGSFFIRLSENIIPDFLAHLLRSSKYRNRLEELATGATMMNLSNKALSNLIISVPDITTQRNILDSLDSLATETNHLQSLYQHKLVNLAELKQSILHKAFTGELTSQPERALQEAVA